MYKSDHFEVYGWLEWWTCTELSINFIISHFEIWADSRVSPDIHLGKVCTMRSEQTNVKKHPGENGDYARKEKPKGQNEIIYHQ